MSKTVRTRYVPVRTSIRLGKYVLLASSTYFYHAFCTQYVLSTYCFRKVRTRYVQGQNSTYLVRTWGKKYIPVQSSTRWYSTIAWYVLGTYRYIPSTYRRFTIPDVCDVLRNLRYRIPYRRVRWSTSG